MRYLNKIIFINSAAIRYSEVWLDGNIHLIGTQGVGKSTILRAILFFYNADTQRLGIPVEKKSYPEYYFPYADSSIIYEVAHERGNFCVMSYKTMNRVCYRFIASPYRPDLFIDADGAPYAADRIRTVLDKQGIRYSGAIATYEEYRNILYGCSDNKKDYSCFALMESASYPNIVRTIQNVLLNARLEAESIKQTIISSLNEADSLIDLSRYRSHLAGFEEQLTDVARFEEPALRRAAAAIASLSDEVRRRDLRLNDLCRSLCAAYLRNEAELPGLARRMHAKEEERNAGYRQREQLDSASKAQTAQWEAQLAVIGKSLSDAKAKAAYYAKKRIDSLIERCGQRELLRQERESLQREMALLSSKSHEASMVHEQLLANLSNEWGAFENEQRKKGLALSTELNAQKEARRSFYRARREALGQACGEGKEQLLAERERRAAEVATLAEQIRSRREQPARSAEWEQLRLRLSHFEPDRKAIELKLKELNYELGCLAKEAETASKQLDADYQQLLDKQRAKQEALTAKVAELSAFLDNQKDSFFNWLSEHKPGWEQNIGQVCDERLLYGAAFQAELADADADSFYGVRFTPAEARPIKTKADYLSEREQAADSLVAIQRFLATAAQDLDTAKERQSKQFQSQAKPIKEEIYQATYDLEQLQRRREADEAEAERLKQADDQRKRQELAQLEQALDQAQIALTAAQEGLAQRQDEQRQALGQLADAEREELDALDKEHAAALRRIAEALAEKQAELDARKAAYDRERLERFAADGGDPKRMELIQSRLQAIDEELRHVQEAQPLVIEYWKDKRELLDKVPDWEADRDRLQLQVSSARQQLRQAMSQLNQRLAKADAELKELRENHRKATDNHEEYQRCTLLDWYRGRQAIFAERPEGEPPGDCRSLIGEITLAVSEQQRQMADLRKQITAYAGHFAPSNVFAFKTTFSDDAAYLDFASDLTEFVAEDKIAQYRSRIQTRNSDIFRQVTADTKAMMAQEGAIRGVVEQINADFKAKNFVGVIQCIEMRIDPSQHKIVSLLKEIKRFNEEYGWDLGQNLFAAAADDKALSEKAAQLLRALIKAMEGSKEGVIRLADFFDLKFRVVENRNDTGFVERLSNIGSEGTDVLVKSMVNIMLLNVFKSNASTHFSDFKLHCMMDEIGKLHPNNVAGILRFANDRDILLINGSPTEQDAMVYKHIYKLEKDTDSFTRIRRVITQFD